MRELRNAQSSIFDSYTEHEHGQRLKKLSKLLDGYPQALHLIEQNFDRKDVARTGACGLSIESILRCLLLKQIVGISYEKLAFHLSDSRTYRTFARLRAGQSPKRSALQAVVRRISPETLQQINHMLVSDWIDRGDLSLEALRIDSTVVDSNIRPPSDSQLLDDGIRVLSRLLAKSKDITGVKLRFSDQRKKSKKLAFRIFYAKRPEKEALYPQLLNCVAITLKQVDRGIERVRAEACDSIEVAQWIDDLEHYRKLLLRVVDQTQRRVFNQEQVPSSEKIVSLFEPHTDIIVKSRRDVQYGHKVNLATQENGFVTYLNIETGNPADAVIYKPVLEACQRDYDDIPGAVVADGGFASQQNVLETRALGVRQVVFNKPVGLGYHDMGVKKKTFKRLADFRAGVEGNISELKRAFGMNRVNWKGRDGFDAYVWASALCYNLVRWTRLDTG